MLALQPTPSPRSLKPNLLPTRINHTGPIRISKRYWYPQRTSPAPKTNAKNSSEETKESHFRGRKLLSRSLHLPDNYKGYVVVKTDEVLPSTLQPARRERDEGARDAPGIPSQADEDAGGAMNEEEEEDDEEDDEDPLLKIMLQEKKRSQQASESIPPTTTSTTKNHSPLNNNGEEEIKTQLLKTHAIFTELDVWGHEAIAGDEDVFVRGMEEWISFAEVMHGRKG